MLRASGLALGLAIFSAAAQAPLDVRLALVIGNGAYAGAPLPNPANDAHAMADTLKQLGFAVIELQNGNRAQMAEAITNIRESLRGKQAIGMLYYAGHGLQLDWRNYMVPVDAKLNSAADVAQQAVDVNSVIDAFKAAGNRMNILVMDACRDNPFGNIASGKGLAPMDAPTGTFLAYATAPGNVAEDGDVKSGNGLYTQFLLEELKKPAARIEDVFKRVRLNVRKQSQGRQIPWESTSLEDDFVFNAGVKIQPRPEVADRERAFAQQKGEWDKIKDSKNADVFYAFLNKYPSGFVAEQAQLRLEQIAKAKIEIQPGRDGVGSIRFASGKFRVGDMFIYASKDFYGKPLPDRTLKVTGISDDMVMINGGSVVWDEVGNLITDGTGVRSPSKGYFPAELSVGKQWRTAYEITRPRDGKNSLYYDFRVKAIEDVKVPAGIFKAFRVEGSGWVSDGDYQEQTYWVDTKTLLIVKDKWLVRGRRPGGPTQVEIRASYDRELASLVLAPR
jgi:hypothetical protein